MENQFLCSQIILPEHKDALINNQKRKENKTSPLYEQQEYEVWECRIKESFEYGILIKVELKKGPENCVQGVIIKIDQARKMLTLWRNNGDLQIPADKIKNITSD